MKPSEAKVLFSAEQLNNRIQELGRQITFDFAGQDLLVVGVLKGSFMFLADLVRTIDLPLAVDFIGVSSYDGTSSTQKITLTKDLNADVKDRSILIVEDIIDTGFTMAHLVKLLKDRQPASIKVCSLLSKPAAREVECPLDYFGFNISNEFVVGYGLDYNEQYRNWPFVGKLN